MGGIWYFWASRPETGGELWQSDGTEVGTVLVKDICPGPVGAADAEPFFVSGNSFHFRALNETTGFELWKSDGTTEGTAMVKDVRPGYDSSNPAGFAVWKENLYFRSLTDDGVGVELWKSDGTGGGTALLKNIRPLNDFSGTPGGFTPDGERLYFFAADMLGSGLSTLQWKELWVSDGTPNGTTKLASVSAVGNSPGDGPQLSKVGGTMFFLGSTPSARGVWTTDGTSRGTKMVQSCNFPDAEKITVMGGAGFFQATVAGGTGMELCRLDGTTKVISTVMDIFPGVTGSLPRSLVAAAGRLFFTANDGVHGVELWSSDGTNSGTALVKDIYPGATSSALQVLCMMDDVLYFTAIHPDHGRELWKSDGTAAGTLMVRDIVPGPDSSNPSHGAAHAGTILFSARDGTHGVELWKTDGSEAGTKLVRDIYHENGSGRATQVLSGEGAWRLFSVGSGSAKELWRTDGTATGSSKLKAVAVVSEMIAFRERVYFVGFTDSHGRELWTSDGTPEGTVMVADMRSGPESFIETIQSTLSKWNNMLLFIANDGLTGVELWRSDGTAAGTVLVKDLLPSSASDVASLSAPRFLAAHEDAWYFSAVQPETGRELWKTDGTESGTMLVREIVPGTGSAGFLSGAVAKGRLFLHLRDALWTSDGTHDGTVQVVQLLPPPYPSLPSTRPYADLCSFGGKGVILEGYDAEHGIEPWISDGTAEGTRLLLDVYPGPISSDLYATAVVGDVAIFGANSPATGRELWRTDGTTEGTFLLKDTWEGASSGIGGSRTGSPDLGVTGGVLYFKGMDATHGLELWRTDGTPEGTWLVEDLAPGFRSSFPNGQTSLAGKLIYAANSDGIRHGLVRMLEEDKAPPVDVADDFGDETDEGWMRITPEASADAVDFTFPDGGYRLSAEPFAAGPNQGTARVLTVRRAEEYGEFCAAVDVTGWDAASDTAVSILARLELGSSVLNGYALTISGGGRSMEISKISNGESTKISAADRPLNLDPAKTYRLVFFGLGDYLEARIFENPNWLIPVATVSAVDGTRGAGGNGLLVSSPSNTACAAVFDNYRANTGPAPELAAIRTAEVGGAGLAWETERALCWRLESSADLTTWTPRHGNRSNGKMAEVNFSTDEFREKPAAYFRFAKGPP